MIFAIRLRLRQSKKINVAGLNRLNKINYNILKDNIILSNHGFLQCDIVQCTWLILVNDRSSFISISIFIVIAFLEINTHVSFPLL